MQSTPQLMPAGALVTVPEPLFVTDSLTELLGVAGGEGGDAGAVAVPVPEPLTAREIVSPAAVKFTLLAKVPPVVGRNRTVTARLAPAASEKGAPDTML